MYLWCVHVFVYAEDMDDQTQQDGGGEDDEEAMEQTFSGSSSSNHNQIRTHPPATVIVSVSCESLVGVAFAGCKKNFRGVIVW